MSPRAQDRSEVRITLYQAQAPISGLFADAKAFIRNDTQDDEQRRALLRRACSSRARLLQWHQRWQSCLLLPREENGHVKCISPAEYSEDGEMLVLLCTYEAFLIACNRLCIALGASDELALEQENLAMASKMTAGQVLGSSTVVRAVAHGVCGTPAQAPILIRCLGAASMALDTAQEWQTAMRWRNSVAGGERGLFIDSSVCLSFLKRIGFGVQRHTAAEGTPSRLLRTTEGGHKIS